MQELSNTKTTPALQNKITNLERFAAEAPSRMQNKILSKVARITALFFHSKDWNTLESSLLELILPSEYTDFIKAKQIIHNSKPGRVNLST